MQVLIRCPLALLLLTGFAMTPPSAIADAPNAFVTRQGDRLFEGDRPLRFVSFNIPNLHLIEDAIDFLGESPWRWPDEYEIADALESIRQMNGRVVRTYVLSVRRESSDMGDCVHVTGPGEFNEEAFVALDRVLKTAGEKGVRVILPLVDNWKWWGGAAEYAAMRGKPADAFWTDAELIADFKKTIAFVVNRRNTITGRFYRDDPTIFGWETGNEIYPPPAWTREIAAYLKSIDANHLVIDGKSLDGVAVNSLDDPNIDVITSHHYPDRGEDIPAAIDKAIQQTRGKKPYFVGEVGFLPTNEIAAIIDRVGESHSAGLLLWSLRGHRREGGFYWHSEPMAKGRYKAYHWPGYPSGEAYDESALLRLARESSFRLQDMPLSPVTVPAAPELLPIVDPAAISWRGSTGASGYKVQRAASDDGPWETIARDVSDAAVPYRPSLNDTGAPLNVPIYYRVVACNESGDSSPSNVVGPVNCDHRTLIDEFAESDLYTEIEGASELVSENPRAVHEDRNRLRISPGGAVCYTPPGIVTGVTVYAFSGANDAPLVSLKDRHGNATPSDPVLSSPKRDGGDYGYLRPLQICANPLGAAATSVTIALASDSVEPLQISRVEIRYSP